MRNLSDYPKSSAPTSKTAYGTFRDETKPGAGDGTDIKAAQMQDLYYALYQVLSLAGQVPNGELENGLNSRQFVHCLTSIGCFKYDSSIVYKKNALVSQTVSDITTIYRSQKDNNTDSLSNNESWINLLTVDQNNHISIKGFELGGNGFIGQIAPAALSKAPVGWHFLDGSEINVDTEFVYKEIWNELTNGNIISLNYADYEAQLVNNRGNCGFFALDKDNGKFRFPIIVDRVFVSQALIAGNIGKYNQDQIVNITGHSTFLSFDRGYGSCVSSSGALQNKTESRWSASVSNGGADNWGVRHQINFDASRVVNTGDQVQPPNIQYPLLICISGSIEKLENVSLQEYADYLRSLAVTGGYIGQVSSSSLNNIPAGYYKANGEIFTKIRVKDGLFPTYLQYLIDHPAEYQTFAEYEAEYNRIDNLDHTVTKPALRYLGKEVVDVVKENQQTDTDDSTATEDKPIDQPEATTEKLTEEKVSEATGALVTGENATLVGTDLIFNMPESIFMPMNPSIKGASLAELATAGTYQDAVKESSKIQNLADLTVQNTVPEEPKIPEEPQESPDKSRIYEISDPKPIILDPKSITIKPKDPTQSDPTTEIPPSEPQEPTTIEYDLYDLRLPYLPENPITYKWESDWFNASSSYLQSFDLTDNGILNVAPEKRRWKLVARVITAQAGYQVGDIVSLDLANVIGNAANYEIGMSVIFRGNAVNIASGNAGEITFVSGKGGYAVLAKTSCQFKLYLEGEIVNTDKYKLIQLYEHVTDTQSTDVSNIFDTLNNKLNANFDNANSNLDLVSETYDDGNGNWYRKYRSGWIEQGGMALVDNSSRTYNLLVPMANPSYHLQGSILSSVCSNEFGLWFLNQTPTTFQATIRGYSGSNPSGGNCQLVWEVKGYYQ